MTTDKTDNRPQISDGGMTYEDVKRIRENPGADTCDNDALRRMIDAAIEKQIPKKPKMDNDNGIYEVEVCPYCMRRLFPYEHHCKCGQALDWSE